MGTVGIYIKKNKILRIFFFKISCFLRVSCYFQHTKFRGGGGGLNFFFRKTILSYFTFYAIFNIKKNRNPPVCPSIRPSVRPSITFSLLVKWEVVSPNTGSRWGQLESISIISSIPLF